MKRLVLVVLLLLAASPLLAAPAPTPKPDRKRDSVKEPQSREALYLTFDDVGPVVLNFQVIVNVPAPPPPVLLPPPPTGH